jgi:DNA/RNA-binding protein KIN17
MRAEINVLTEKIAEKMSKHEAGSSKWISGQMKSRGLSKLKYFCQMCNKQCRDANGFKCHSQSESHRQQMELFLSDPEKFVNDFSTQFEEQFVDTLRDIAKGEWISPKEVYSAVVLDREHVHMNATKWTTLTEFLEFLLSKGSVRMTTSDQSGDMIQFIDLEKEASLRRQGEADARRREKEQKRIQLEEDTRKKALLAFSTDVDRTVSAPSGLTRTDPNHKISISLGSSKTAPPLKRAKVSNPFNTSDTESDT